MISRRMACAFLGATLLGATSLAAQPKQGDLVISAAFNAVADQGVFYVDWSSGPSAPLNTLVSGVQVNSIQTSYLNAEAVGALVGGPTGKMLRFRSNGTYTTFSASLPAQIHAADLNQDTRYVCVAGGSTTSGVYSIISSGTSFTTLTTLAVGANGMCRDNENGDFAIVTFGSPSLLLRTSWNGGSTTTIRNLGGTTSNGATGICYMNDVNRYAVTRAGTSGLEIISHNGGLVASRATAGTFTQAVCYDDLQRRLYIVSNVGHVQECSNSGVVLRTRQFAGKNFTGCDTWSDHPTALNTTGARGTQAFINFRFPSSGSRQYCAALSLDNQPGLAIDTRYQSIKPDPLFFITVCGNLPIFTTGFTGTLNSVGAASGAFTIPSGLPVGTMLYAVASAVNPTFPSNLDLGIPEGVRVTQ